MPNNHIFKPGRFASQLARLVIASACLLANSPVAAAVISDIRMWHAPERSRIVFDMDRGTKFTAFTLQNPDRVVIDLPATKLNSAIPEPGTTGKLISKIRAGQFDRETLRLVFDVALPVRYHIQLLNPVDNYRYRLVVDYYPQSQAAIEPDVAANPAPGASTLPPVPERKDEILVLIDPGHGGEDPGALGRRAKEKIVVLQIARRLKEQVDMQPGMRAVLSRTGDYYVGLRRRTSIARELGADLFVSIHADGFKDPRARGASVYALSRRGATSETARWLANRENSSDLIGGVSLGDKDSLLAGVLLDLSMSKTVSESISFGREVLSELKKVGRVHSERVEQAGFVVLKSPDIPSILVETAYITNPTEEKLLRSKNHQEKIAAAIVQGILNYIRRNPGVYES